MATCLSNCQVPATYRHRPVLRGGSLSRALAGSWIRNPEELTVSRMAYDRDAPSFCCFL
jgi:hypothetical protein